MLKKICKAGLGLVGVYGLYRFAKSLNLIADTRDVNNTQQDVGITAEDNETKIKRLRVELTGMFREVGDYQFINHLEEAIERESTVLVVGPVGHRASLIDWMQEYYKACGKDLTIVDQIMTDEFVKVGNSPMVYSAPKVLESDAIDVIFEISYPEDLTDIESLPTISADLPKRKQCAIELRTALESAGYNFRKPIEHINFILKILRKADEVIIVGEDSIDRVVLYRILSTIASDIHGAYVIDSKCISKKDAIAKGVFVKNCAIFTILGSDESKCIGYSFYEKEEEN